MLPSPAPNCGEIYRINLHLALGVASTVRSPTGTPAGTIAKDPWLLIVGTPILLPAHLSHLTVPKPLQSW